VAIEDEVLAAAGARARALATADAAALRELLHPAFGWISHRGEAFDRDSYIAANTGRDGVLWRAQTLEEVRISVVEQTAILRCIVTDVIAAEHGAERLRMPMTQTWVRHGVRWRCLAGHAGPKLA
jgi:hypothetical protein